MEIVVKDSKISFNIKDKKINGITGTHLDDILEILKLNTNKKVIIDKKEITDNNKYQYKRKIEVVSNYFKVNNNYSSVLELFQEEINNNQSYPKDINKKIRDALKIIGLDKAILEESLYTLASSEERLISLAMSLLTNPDLIILIEPFKGLDQNNIKKVVNILNKLIEKYQKTIIIVSTNSEWLYTYTEHLIIYINSKILLEGKTSEIYQDIDFLKKHHLPVPEIVEFSYLARKNKDIKLDYFKDIRDIIKDIYKHV